MRLPCEVAEGEQAVEAAAELAPDIVLLDLNMPGIGGMEALRRIRARSPDVKVLVLTVHEDENLALEALKAGASGYIIKRAAETELINAIFALYHGDLYVHPAMTRALLKELNPAPTRKGRPELTLTARELEVMRLLVRGYTNRQVAEVLNLSIRTVEGHRANLMGKLGLHTRVELVNYAEEHGLLDMPSFPPERSG
jgi:two-component system, NarL family, response regulator NreC